MLKRLLITAAILTLFLSFPTATNAQSGEDLANSTDDILQDFCESRQSNIINLETWYAGRCDPEGEESTFIGQNRGFGDIIILHLYEILKGEGSAENDAEILREVIDSIRLEGSSQNQHYLALFTKLGEVAGQRQGGLISDVVKITALPYSHQPASTSEYIAHVRNNLQQHTLVQPVFAQNTTGPGYGFSRLEGFLPLWRAFRDMAYFFFILAFVIYGFMIMFRVKINPQTAANIQLALPKLVITLILITFSYAIVGLMFDLMWVGYYLILNSLHTFGVFGFNPTENIFSLLFSGQLGLIPAALSHMVIAFVSGVPGTISALLNIHPTITGVGLLLTAIIHFFITGGLSFLVVGILLIAILIAFIKLAVKLITAYVTVFLYLILSPLILLSGILPGKNDAFSNWLTNLTANIIVFPVVSILLLFSGLFAAQTWTDIVDVVPEGWSVSDTSTRPPAVPVLSHAPLGEAASATIGAWYALIGLALLLMAPKFVDMIKDAFKIKPFPYGSAAMEFLAGGLHGRQAATALRDKDYGGAVSSLAQASGQRLELKDLRGKEVKPTPDTKAGAPSGDAAGTGGRG